jgi:hypothetical protein
VKCFIYLFIFFFFFDHFQDHFLPRTLTVTTGVLLNTTIVNSFMKSGKYVYLQCVLLFCRFSVPVCCLVISWRYFSTSLFVSKEKDLVSTNITVIFDWKLFYLKMDSKKSKVIYQSILQFLLRTTIRAKKTKWIWSIMEKAKTFIFSWYHEYPQS